MNWIFAAAGRCNPATIPRLATLIQIADLPIHSFDRRRVIQPVTEVRRAYNVAADGDIYNFDATPVYEESKLEDESKSNTSSKSKSSKRNPSRAKVSGTNKSQ